MKYLSSVLSAAVASFLLISCGGSTEGEGDSSPTSSPETPAETVNTPEKIEVPAEIEVVIEGNDQMQFSLDKIEVTEGQTVVLTFNNVGELPVEAMGHNWTLLAKGVDPVEYGTSAMTFKDNNYQNPDRISDVIAHTRILGPGESETITFTAPSKGLYKYVCTFPGHAGLMKGSFMVKGK